MDNELSTSKRYYWLKLRDNFFNELSVIALRKMKNGDTICVIFLKMLLISLNSDGVFDYRGIGLTVDEEIALAIGESSEMTASCIAALIDFGIAERINGDGLRLKVAADFVGAECFSAKRMRDMRRRNSENTQSDPKESKANEHKDTNHDCTTSHCDEEKRENREDTETEKERREEREGRPAGFARPTLDEVRAYCVERKNQVDPEKWLDYYTANGFRVGKSKMVDWRAAVRQWERNGYDLPRTVTTPVTQVETPPQNYANGW